QMEAVLQDLPVAAIKTGMIPSSACVEMVAEKLAEAGWRGRLVVDPVLSTSAGQPLMDRGTVEALKRHLLPLAGLVTPNIQEARQLAGRDLASWDLGRCLLDMGALAVLLTGGDGPDETVRDLLVTASERMEIRHRRLSSSSTHGTGCTLSAAIAARLARGDTLTAAVPHAADYVHQAIARARPLGRGSGPLHHFHRFWSA
ncbi:MAG: hydroxymethylpyrimidine/phosphomethylpyrimidine kinase, partial [Acidobacteriota bacterium]